MLRPKGKESQVVRVKTRIIATTAAAERGGGKQRQMSVHLEHTACTEPLGVARGRLVVLGAL
jgi:hypothetical protein